MRRINSSRSGRKALCFFAAACLPIVMTAQDAKEMVSRALKSNEKNQEIGRNYTYLERREQLSRDGAGRVGKRKSETWDITILEGSSYRRLVGRDDKPLAPAEQWEEEKKLQKSQEKRRKETPEERLKRIAEERARSEEKQREPLREVMEAFDFRLAGEEVVDGYATWVIDASPKPGYKGKSIMSRAVLPRIKARFWICKTDDQGVKMEAEILDTISIGLSMIRVSKGSRISFELARVNEEVWLPRRMSIKAAGRVMLVKGLNTEMEFTYSEYKKFQADSRIILIGEPQSPH